ncbi:MAG TPA: MBL fold metallo-hydrolase [Actinomycetales bacterium]|nr:MBL fold metallo-hydrolase [Actinomycetales bacterium]
MSPARTTNLIFLGASGTVTGSKFLLEIDYGLPTQRRILIDAGQFQGEKAWREKNWEEFPVDPATIDTVILTHAHMDHVGYLPALVRNGFHGLVICTEGTARLAEIVMRDAGKIQEQDARYAADHGYSKHDPPLPLFDTTDVENTIPLLHSVPFYEDIDLEDGITAHWVRAAHILGSASVRIETPETSILFSGDLGRHHHPILKPRDTPTGADWVVMETTYGDREHPEPEEEHAEMADAIRRTVARGGQVLIPAFAIDRTETILKALTDMYKEGRIPDVPVYVDSPMGLRALAVYADVELEELQEGMTLNDFLGIPRLRESMSSDDSKAINRQTEPIIIISSSGMLEGGRVLHHLKRLVTDERNTIILTGYQAAGTRGRQLEEGAREVKVHGKYYRVKAEILRDDEFSVHGDASDLMDWAQTLDPAPITAFMVHGDPQVARHFANRLEDELDWVAVVPRYGEVVSLIEGSEDPPDLPVKVPKPRDGEVERPAE